MGIVGLTGTFTKYLIGESIRLTTATLVRLWFWLENLYKFDDQQARKCGLSIAESKPDRLVK
ncbi:MAG: hypothetical protein JWM11_4750 [Planctomycetaceae bacterium]|nr:hypothetical protein [Planctomycetaceae bacterium]